LLAGAGRAEKHGFFVEIRGYRTLRLLRVNGPVVTAQIVMEVSASLVGADGQVLRIGGRLLVQEASRHSWAFGGPVPLDVDAWRAGVVAGEVTRLIGAARDLAAADAAGMLAPANAVPSTGSNAQLVNPAVAAEMAAMSAPVIMEAGDADG
jgi:hypothetical protein